MGKWVFEALGGAAVRREPKEAELFKTEQTREGEYSGNDALVREVLQNAIDAGSGREVVRVRLAIHEPGDAPVPARLRYYFERLRAPLSVKRVPYNGIGYPSVPCRFLVCEDFGTRGLEGDVTLFRDPPQGNTAKEYFYWFWRNIGRSGKTGQELGRWGLGKLVFRAASRVGCMFGLTVRESDSKRLVMGQAVLQCHTHENTEYQPEGYFCGKQTQNGLPLPIGHEQEIDKAEVDSFCREWKLTRKDQPGLSVVSPFIPAEIKGERLLEAVAVHFFTRIVTGNLVVEVAAPGLGTIVLDREHLAAACKKIVWDGPKRTKRHVAPPITFAIECFRSPPSAVTEVLGRERLPELNEESLSAETLTQLRRQYASGELVRLRIRLWLPRKDVAGAEGQLDVYVQRVDDGQRHESYFVREGMTITKINSRPSLRGVRGLVNVEMGPLAELLGDTEGPAHEDWDTSQERPEERWKTWKGRVNFVRKIVDNVVDLLTPKTTEPDFDLLSDIFSIERVTGEQPKKLPGEKTKDEPTMEPIVVDPKWFRITERAGGFTITRTTGVPMPDKASLRVSLAYDLPQGNPLKSWNAIDFVIDEGDIRPKGKGFEPVLEKGNVLQLADVREGFHFSIDGFDQNRDLLVRVDDLSESNGVAHD